MGCAAFNRARREAAKAVEVVEVAEQSEGTDESVPVTSEQEDSGDGEQVSAQVSAQVSEQVEAADVKKRGRKPNVQ